MDANANWRPTQGSDPAAAAAAAAGVDPNAPAGGDWRAQLQPEARSRIVNKIMETLKKHLPVSVPEGLNELQKIAVRFEEKIYTAATNQSDYLRKISLKMLSMETKTQQGPGNAQVIPNQNNPGQAPGLPQGSNQAHTSAIPLMSQQQGRQPNTSSSVQASSLTNIGQNMPGVNQTSTMQNVSVMPQNTMNNGLMQGSSQDIYAAQRQMAGRQQQQSQQLMYQQQQQMLMKQKLQAEFTYATTYSAAAIFVAANTAIITATHHANGVWPSPWAVHRSTDAANGHAVSYSKWYSTESTEFRTICAIITPATSAICWEAAATRTTLHASAVFYSESAAQYSITTAATAVDGTAVKFTTKSANWSTECRCGDAAAAEATSSVK
ncbi:hypothetical protein ACQ4PT_052373 [Festuca glaucescens]